MGALPQHAFPLLSYAEYRIRDDESPYRSEYYQGAIYSMAGSTPTHNHLALNAVEQLRPLLREQSCLTFASDVAVITPGNQACFYPDVSVVCGATLAEVPRQIPNPALIIEVLSSSTRNTDWTLKLPEYKRIPSLLHILLIDSERVEVTHFSRGPENTWLPEPRVYKQVDDVLALAPWNVQMPVSKLYESSGLAPTA